MVSYCEDRTVVKTNTGEKNPRVFCPLSLFSNLDNNQLYEYCIIMCMYLGVHFRMLHVSCIHPNALYS